MPVYHISYDLRKKREFNYEHLMDALRSYTNWCHMLESDWAVVTSQSASDVCNHLRQHIDKGDCLFVGRLSRDAATFGFSHKICDWLDRHLGL